LELTELGDSRVAGRSFVILKVGMILPLALLMDVVSPGVCQVHHRHRGSDFEERSGNPSPYIGDSFREVVGESPLFKWGDTEGYDVPDLGQVSEVATHDVQRALLLEKTS